MTTKNVLIDKIADYLQNRDKQTNFGACIRCEKRVYWSTSKVASHIRSGHCQGASEDEVQRFKNEFVYDGPKNLVHKSVANKRFSESFDELKPAKLMKTSSKHEADKEKAEPGEYKTIKDDPPIEYEIEEADDQTEEILYEEYSAQEDPTDDEKVEILFLPEVNSGEKPSAASSLPDLSKEDKFINAVYPQFKGKTRLQLIDEIFDLKRRNELLLVKAKTYENTINRLLN